MCGRGAGHVNEPLVSPALVWGTGGGGGCAMCFPPPPGSSLHPQPTLTPLPPPCLFCVLPRHGGDDAVTGQKSSRRVVCLVAVVVVS